MLWLCDASGTKYRGTKGRQLLGFIPGRRPAMLAEGRAGSAATQVHLTENSNKSARREPCHHTPSRMFWLGLSQSKDNSLASVGLEVFGAFQDSDLELEKLARLC